MLNQETVATPALTSVTAVESDFEWLDDGGSYTPTPEEVHEAFFEMAYDDLTEKHEVATSLHEPFSYGALRIALENWPQRHIGRFVAGTLICPVDDLAAASLTATPDRKFFAFTRAVDEHLRQDFFGSAEPLGVAAIRACSSAASPTRYHFLMEMPTEYTLAEMKDLCLAAGLEARSNYVYPMHLVGCESASEWAELLMSRRRPGDYIDSFAFWHWRLPAVGREVHRRGWARRRALASIKRAA